MKLRIDITITVGFLVCFALVDSLDSTWIFRDIIKTVSKSGTQVGGNTNDVQAWPDERVRLNGYPSESHFVTTPDGYVLNLFRIPYSNKLQNKDSYRPAVLLQHGMVSNSDAWLAGGPDNALAYLLADAGFDVWLGNARGNIYSRQNVAISTNNPKFWYFDWHEIGSIDVPTMIDYIIDQTGQPKIHYAGHSQGTTVYFVMMSERKEYNEKIKSAHMLAPCAFFAHGSSQSFTNILSMVGDPGTIWNKVFANMEMLPYNRLINRAADTACGLEPALKFLCRNMWLLFAGNGFQNTNVTAMQELIETHPAGASTNQMIHYIQLGEQSIGRFCQMDYGEKKNQKIYGQSSPPDYDLENIRAPTYLYSSENDNFCTAKDVDTLVAKIKNLAGDYRIPEQSFNHLDFIVAKNMREMVNEPVMVQ
ncbi:lipase 3-like [Musca vetustissima]|uniref:lipase 3-like n=1 Tax=Musca vetustissima TaxID=27455 RepID=UPI002AB7A826|nr:lipase 3-like [Musca vetustissima]